MANGWNFPSNNFGTVTGIGEAGIETFKGSTYRSLAREICQNSMDARYDKTKPVIVEFSSFTIGHRDIPDYNHLYNAINSCLSFWTEQNNKKTIDFFKKAKKIIEKYEIYVLRISDYNTKGLQGSDKEFNTPWQNLVKAAGVSDKNGSDGGSFGIGKSAPFACSDLRTLFYATKDVDGLSAFQGIAKLVSFREKSFLGKDKDSITSGTGFYTSDKRNSPLKECISIDPNYSRKEYGTDIYILGFSQDTEWKTEIISSILDEFLIAIYNGDLVAKVDGYEIDFNNLENVVEVYKNSAKTAYNYYQVLNDNSHIIQEHEFPGLGTIQLYILIKQGLHRKIMMCRKNGMKIFDKANISGTIQFAGICILKDEKINSYFREMENPQHNAWEPERHTTDSKTKAKNNMLMLYKYVKNAVIEIGRKTTVAEMDAEGMGEFLPDTEYVDTNNQQKEEAVSPKTSSIDIKTSALKKEQIGYEEPLKGNKSINYEDDLFDDIEDEAYGGTGSKDAHDDGHNKTHTGTGFGQGEGENPGTNGNGDNEYVGTNDYNYDDNNATNIGTMSVRMFLSDKINNVYTLIFVPKRNSGKGYLQISLSGEQKNVKASILTAKDLINNSSLQCKENKIYIDNINKMEKNKISFSIAYAEECSLEVKLYGYSS
ncbi:MAG: hypothetical protein ACI4RC_07405 [Oscillospiraceae bacterium]